MSKCVGVLHTSTHLGARRLRSARGLYSRGYSPAGAGELWIFSCDSPERKESANLLRVCVEPRMYREALALSLHQHRFGLEVRIAPSLLLFGYLFYGDPLLL